MKNEFRKVSRLVAALAFCGAIASCSDSSENFETPTESANGRWVTLAGTKQGTTAGDGNGGMVVYSISEEDAKNPNKEFSIFENGYVLPSQRTARVYASTDGNILYNIPYTGDNGGLFNRYKINGGANYSQDGGTVNIAQYATNSPRWGKLYDKDQTGVANNVAAFKQNEGSVYQYTRGTATTVAIDLQNPKIKTNVAQVIPLSPEEEVLGHHIWRMDSPTLNRAGDKLYIGTWMRKMNPATGEVDNTAYTRIGSKTVVLDYPSLKNPKVITSTLGFGDTAGYRSLNSFLSDDGNVYQATSRDSKGGHILKINQNNEYDNSYDLNLDKALGLQGVAVENWRYVGNGIAYIMYTHQNATVSTLTNSKQSFVARVDLNARTANRVEGLPYDVDMYFFQYQGILVHGDNIYLPVSAIGKDGNIYIINKNTGTVTKGAKLKNAAGAQFIGAF